ncbi:GNAT family N-acetyltransferase [Undibacterium jejuense]|uniref:GNAT family N-acetyltransferase n=1 Tax=Undibacterium jejuense TaxID=1344949 RepID=A0A923HHL0_9BURK|nr:GNAT family N-acetyltransferase [Undibacterium jejuense]MBC3863140.1 GNAT family N-acetyltransferase [Undibacterium jejuense]
MEISTDKARLNVSLIHQFLSEQSAWAKGIPLEKVQRSIEHSLCFGAYIDGKQIAFARVVADKATFAYLMDVFVLPAYRGQGHAKTLMHAVQEHPDLQEIRRFILVSSTARGLYEKFGFQAPAKPETFMEINRPTIYLR